MTEKPKIHGVLFVNDNEKEHWYGDMSGSLEIPKRLEKGRYFLGAWKNVTSLGKEYYSLSIGNKIEDKQPSKLTETMKQINQTTR